MIDVQIKIYLLKLCTRTERFGFVNEIGERSLSSTSKRRPDQIYFKIIFNTEYRNVISGWVAHIFLFIFM